MNDKNDRCSWKQISCPKHVWPPAQMSGGTGTRVGKSSFIIFSFTFFYNKRRFFFKPKFFFYFLLLFLKFYYYKINI